MKPNTRLLTNRRIAKEPKTILGSKKIVINDKIKDAIKLTKEIGKANLFK